MLYGMLVRGEGVQSLLDAVVAVSQGCWRVAVRMLVRSMAACCVLVGVCVGGVGAFAVGAARCCLVRVRR